ncbi:MAG: FUSC family protein [Nostoc sp. ChiQUE02]|uniref:FUSC family protein n=1 Tax=Nostoc sp. ChiQUE02 TaxID=3075377 RepID=UPI003A100B94
MRGGGWGWGSCISLKREPLYVTTRNYCKRSLTIQRVVGTILGEIISIALVLLVNNSLAMSTTGYVYAVCFLLLVFVAMSVRALSYSIFIILLTPAMILLSNIISAAGWKVGS